MKEFVTNIYPVNLIVSKDYKSVNKHYYNPFDDNKEIRKQENSLATTFKLNNKEEGKLCVACIVFNTNRPTVNTIAHEAFHAACIIMNKVDVELCSHSEEAFAYLVGWIAEKCYDYLYK